MRRRRVDRVGARRTGAGSPQQVWRTVHVDLELVDGRWLVAARNADSGPTPAATNLRCSPAGTSSRGRGLGSDRGRGGAVNPRRCDADVAVGSDRGHGAGPVPGRRGLGVGHRHRRDHRLAGEGLRAARLVRVVGHGSVELTAVELGVVLQLRGRAVPDGGHGRHRAAGDLRVLCAHPGRARRTSAGAGQAHGVRHAGAVAGILFTLAFTQVAIDLVDAMSDGIWQLTRPKAVNASTGWCSPPGS
jgi:hypothetical protein